MHYNFNSITQFSATDKKKIYKNIEYKLKIQTNKKQNIHLPINKQLKNIAN